MHPLIDKKIVDTIRDTGKTSEQLPDRTDILEKNNLPYNREAENVIISGCQILSMSSSTQSSSASATPMRRLLSLRLKNR